MSISKIKIGSQIYDIKDNDILQKTSTENANVFFKVNEEGKLDTSAIMNLFNAEVIMNNKIYGTFEEALAEATVSTIKLVHDVILEKQAVIQDGQIITIDLNGHNIIATEDMVLTSGLLAVHHGGSLIIKGQGTIYGCAPSGLVYAGIVLTVDKTDNDSSKPARLTINGGHIIGECYGISGNGTDATRGNTELIVNGGTIEAIGNITTEGNVGIYQPQYNSKTTINGGTVIGHTAIEVRSGNLNINNGTFIGNGYAYNMIHKNNNGPASNGAAVAVIQHITKQPINVKIKNGLFKGQIAFIEANHSNDFIYGNNITLSIDGGSYGVIGDNVEVIHSDNISQFVHGGDFTHAAVAKKCIDPEKFDVDNWSSLYN